ELKHERLQASRLSAEHSNLVKSATGFLGCVRVEVHYAKRLILLLPNPSELEFFSTITVPLVPSTVTISPSRNLRVAFPVAITVGIPCSRATIAACERRLPVSVTTAPAMANRGDQAGVVTLQ